MKDVQNSTDKRGIDIQKVGVKDVELPLIIQRKNDTDSVVWAKATASVSLPKDYKGTHMSRFIEVLTEWRNKNMLGVDIKGCLKEIVEKLDALQEQTKQLEQIYTKKIKECDELKQSILQKAFRGEL